MSLPAPFQTQVARFDEVDARTMPATTAPARKQDGIVFVLIEHPIH
jgi:hypothetical protein